MKKWPGFFAKATPTQAENTEYTEKRKIPHTNYLELNPDGAVEL